MLRGRNQVDVEPIDYRDEKISTESEAIAKAWKKAGGMPERRTKPEDIECSGPDWSMADEGVNVASEFGKLGFRIPTDQERYAQVFRASVQGQCIGYMMLEARNDDLHEREYIFLRWLFGHPTVKGAGKTLVTLAKKVSTEKKKLLIVQSAKSSVSFYEKCAFTKVWQQLHEGDCGCALLEWGKDGE